MRSLPLSGLAIATAVAAFTATSGAAQSSPRPPAHSGGHGGHGQPPAARAPQAPAPAKAKPREVRPPAKSSRADSVTTRAGHAAHAHAGSTPRDTTTAPTRLTRDSTRADTSSGRIGPHAAARAESHPAASSHDTSAANASQHHSSTGGARDGVTTRSGAHEMWMRPIGGWSVMGMAQVFPTLTAGPAHRERGLQRAAGVYATQPAIMANVASPGARFVLRTTLNFEDLTQANGELTFGGWGEGFIDSRHPHTLLHEAMLTANWWDVAGGALSISAGKGFAPYGTDDPMGRPAVKFPTNHHLSQVLERFTTNVAYLKRGWGIEAGLFGGAEPKHAYDFSNVESFGDSWSARLSKRFGAGFGPAAPWELGTSYARIEEAHHGKTVVTELFNANVRHARPYAFGTLYTMAEWSRSKPRAGRGHYALLGETSLGMGSARRHQPYARVEYATRPEYEREGAPGTPDFFRYDHDSHEIGATRWLIATAGYGYTSSALPTSVRPYVEVQRNSVRGARGPVDPRVYYGSRGFWTVSAGARVFFGGGAMRMGGYGALDPMTAAMRPGAGHAANHGGHEER